MLISTYVYHDLPTCGVGCILQMPHYTDLAGARKGNKKSKVSESSSQQTVDPTGAPDDEEPAVGVTQGKTSSIMHYSHLCVCCHECWRCYLC